MAVGENGWAVALRRSVSASWDRKSGRPFSSSWMETAGHRLDATFERARARISCTFAEMNSESDMAAPSGTRRGGTAEAF